MIFGCRDKRVYCLNRQTGIEIWKYQTQGEVDSSPVICGDKVIIPSTDGRLYLLRLTDGKEIWSYEIGDAITASPAIADGIVVIGAENGYVYAFGSE